MSENIENRTIAQHNTEWLYYRIIADVTGNTAYEIYENMAMRLLKVIDEDGDLAFIKPNSLKVTEHNKYLECIVCIAAEFGILLPEPTQDTTSHYRFKKLNKKSNVRK